MSQFLPQPGEFYYHFKRNADRGLEDGVYYVVGIGMHTENRSEHFVVLKPLYYCEPRKEDEKGISLQIRPLDKFLSEIDRVTYKGPRFWEIEDSATIEYLKNTFLFNSKFLDE
jgi:hypothetical protein